MKKIGAWLTSNGWCDFTVWAIKPESVNLILSKNNEKKNIAMNRDECGYWTVGVDSIASGDQYMYELDNKVLRPDPASHCQKHGVHGFSQIVDHLEFPWNDSSWDGINLENYIIYELHIGTFTNDGTFDAAIDKIEYLKKLGITAIEIMPLSQFPGDRNWGYDGVYPFAPQTSYGGVNGLKRFVDACHQCDISIILDVVYNHFGPEGNYLWDFGNYFTDKYTTSWGDALNFDAEHSGAVRNYFIQNALYWFEIYHIDALRLDAIHGIIDTSAKHFLNELSECVDIYSHKTGRQRYLIAESDLNDACVVEPRKKNGRGLHSQWCDDFHHALHAVITGEKNGYYSDFGSIEQVKKSYMTGYSYTWTYSPYRKRFHGSDRIPSPQCPLVAFVQNHDQVGNRMLGERLQSIISFDQSKLVAAILLTSPFVPLIFMGEEYAESSPFLYFVHHSDEKLIEAVRTGRKREFASFGWNCEPPDPQAIETFDQSKLRWSGCAEGTKHETMVTFYTELIRLRKTIPALKTVDRSVCIFEIIENSSVICIQREHSEGDMFILANFSNTEALIKTDKKYVHLKKYFDSNDRCWLGKKTKCPTVVTNEEVLALQPYQCTLYYKDKKG